MGNLQQVIEDLRDDNNYYGDYGKKYLSNSDIKMLLRCPENFQKPWGDSTNFLHGKYVHTAILEPEKLGNFPIIDSSTRSTKKYKEEADGELCLLQCEMEGLDAMINRIKNNKMCKDLIFGESCIYEQPGVKELEGEWWKGKADVINKDRGFIIDLKTSADIKKFKWNAKNYNYDSQAYIYSQIFNLDFLFIVIDKSTLQLGMYECDDSFYESGREKVAMAVEAYNKWIKNPDADFDQRIEFDTLF